VGEILVMINPRRRGSSFQRKLILTLFSHTFVPKSIVQKNVALPFLAYR